MSGRHVPVAAEAAFRVCGLFIVIAAVLLAAAPAGAAPALTVTPSTGLTDGQVVNVRVAGFDPELDVALTVVQCNPNPRSIEDCDEVGTEDALALETDGTGSAPFRVHVLPSDAGGTVRCDAGHPCALAVLSDPEDFNARMAVVPISFGGGSGGNTTSSSAASTYAASSASPSGSAPSGSAASSPATGSSATSAPATSGPAAAVPATTNPAPSSPPSSTAVTSLAAPRTANPTVVGARETAAAPSTGQGSAAAPSATSQPVSLTLPAPLASTGPGVQVLLLGLGSALGMGGVLVRRRALRDGRV
jgi:Neocarzinostatin family